MGSYLVQPPGLFALHPLSERHGMTNVIPRAAIVIGVFLAAYGLLAWRNVFRRLSLTNYIIVLFCAPVLLLCASKMKDWEYFLDQQRGFSILNDLAVAVIQNMILVCTIFWVLGGPTALTCANGFTD
jgi:drug/metabolite transporter (DMT)-like permease